jgi:hypothetical protein
MGEKNAADRIIEATCLENVLIGNLHKIMIPGKNECSPGGKTLISGSKML